MARGKTLALFCALALVCVPCLPGDDDGDFGIFDLLFASPPLAPSPRAWPSLSPQPSSLLGVKPLPTPSPLPEMAICPVCGASYLRSPVKPGKQWGERLDLRKTGPIEDPPHVDLCPGCGFPVYKRFFLNDELAWLRSYVMGGEFSRAIKGFPSYYAIALLKSSGKLSLPGGLYDVAIAYLQAAWQSEDLGNADIESKCLESSLKAMEAFLASDSQASPYYRSAILLRGELLRRLGRFDAARLAMEKAKADKAFAAAYLQQVIAKELALIKVQDSSPGANYP